MNDLERRQARLRRARSAIRVELAVGFAAPFVVALVVAGCALLPQPGSAMDHILGDPGGWSNCPVREWVTGVITPNADGYAAIRDDQGVLHTLVWGSSNTAVIEWGRRYRIGGSWFGAPGAELWACGGEDAVIPQ